MKININKINPNIAGELLREMFFLPYTGHASPGNDGSGWTFRPEVSGLRNYGSQIVGIEKLYGEVSGWSIEEIEQAKDDVLAQKVMFYTGKLVIDELEVTCEWYWFEDYNLSFDSDEFHLYNTDAKKDHVWKRLD